MFWIISNQIFYICHFYLKTQNVESECRFYLFANFEVSTFGFCQSSNLQNSIRQIISEASRVQHRE